MLRGIFVAVLVLLSVACGHDDRPMATRFPEVEWLPLRGPLGASRVEVVVLLDGRPTPGILDTGAMQTSVSLELAQRLGLHALATETDERLDVVDAHGDVKGAWRTKLESLALGRVWVDDVDVTVLPMGRELVLIGYDVLRRFDMVLVSDAGVVGLMPAGTAPQEGRSVPVRLDAEGRSLLVDGVAAGSNEDAHAVLVVDTGADTTVFPSMPAMLAAVPVDMRFTSVTRGVNGEKQEPGRYALRPLRIGGVDVGNLFAYEGTGEGGQLGLLGNDVLRRYRTTIVSANAPGGPRLLLADVQRHPPVRACDKDALQLIDDDGTPCLRVALKGVTGEAREALRQDQAWNAGGVDVLLGEAREAAPTRVMRDDACLEVTIRRGAAKKRLQFVVGDDAGVLHGAVLSVIANIEERGNGSKTVCLSLPDSTRLLGLQAGAALHLVAVRRDDDVDPALCDRGICHWYNGP